MKDLAPHITRKRFMIEGFYKKEVNEMVIREFFEKVTGELSLRMYSEPIVFATGDDGKPENQGFDAFVPLLDSGISVYVWVAAKFTSIVLYTCKDFDEDRALQVVKDFFEIEEAESMLF
jgi:S-adenosylmethionine/arginine decarboxylase-like enzyme